MARLGYGFPPARERLRALDEGVQIMQQAWRDGVATLDGKIYQVDGAIVRPLPLQEGGIPFWIAGGGEQVTLRIAAQYAQYTNFDGTPAGFAHKSRVLAEHCRRFGRDYDAIVRSANYNVIIGRDEREVADKLGRLQDKYTGLVGAQMAARQLGAYRGMPGVGTPEQIAANLAALKVSGMTYAITYFPDLAYDTSSLELFESEVIPALA